MSIPIRVSDELMEDAKQQIKMSLRSPLKTVAKISDSKVVEKIDPLPKWAEDIINSI